MQLHIKISARQLKVGDVIIGGAAADGPWPKPVEVKSIEDSDSVPSLLTVNRRIDPLWLSKSCMFLVHRPTVVHVRVDEVQAGDVLWEETFGGWPYGETVKDVRYDAPNLQYAITYGKDQCLLVKRDRIVLVERAEAVDRLRKQMTTFPDRSDEDFIRPRPLPIDSPWLAAMDRLREYVRVEPSMVGKSLELTTYELRPGDVTEDTFGRRSMVVMVAASTAPERLTVYRLQHNDALTLYGLQHNDALILITSELPVHRKWRVVGRATQSTILTVCVEDLKIGDVVVEAPHWVTGLVTSLSVRAPYSELATRCAEWSADLAYYLDRAAKVKVRRYDLSVLGDRPALPADQLQLKRNKQRVALPDGTVPEQIEIAVEIDHVRPDGFAQSTVDQAKAFLLSKVEKKR